LDVEEKRKITSLPGIELQSSIPYTDGTPVQNDVLAALFLYPFAVHEQTSNYAL
jgi:hypothetical protein